MVDLSIEKCCRLGPEHVTLYIYSDFAPTVMARQSKAGIRPRSTYRERVSLYDKGREKLCKHGYEEYMPCYFSRRPRWRFGSEMYYFGLLGDHFGFGSGANSSIAKHFLGNQRGNMKRFILEPREFDFVVRYQPDERSLDIILTRMPFSTCMAVDYHEFADRFGFEFREVVDHPRIVQWRETVALQRRVGVHESERGIEIDRFYAAELVDSSKREFRTRQDASV